MTVRAIFRRLHFAWQRLRRLIRPSGKAPARPTLRAGRKYRVQYVAEEPNELGSQLIYLVGDNGYLTHAAFLCPCGCGEPIFLNLLTDARPCWSVTVYRGVPSIAPSVNRVRGCRSHFFIRSGRVEWWVRRAE